MQFLSHFWPNHLPKRMEAFRNQYEHHWIIEMTDEGIQEAETYFNDFFKDPEGDFFICNPKEGKKAMLLWYGSASAIGRYQALNNKKIGKMMSLDIAFPRNEKKWLETLPKDIDDKIELKFYYGHLFCYVFHHNYILKKGVDSKKLKEELLALYDQRNAEYPAEHNTGHEYVAKPVLLTEFYKTLDPTATFSTLVLGRTYKQTKKLEMKLIKDLWNERYENQDTAWDIGHISTPLKEYFEQLENKKHQNPYSRLWQCL